MGGRYLYCVANAGEKTNLGKIGIEESEVYTISYKDLCAVVHICPAEPYESEDRDKVRNWVVTHEKVVELAWEKFDTILPLRFNTIIKGDEGSHPEENVEKWLGEDYENLKEKMAKVRGKAEYGVQISWHPKIIARKIAQANEEIKKLEQKIKSKSEGTAYMYKYKLESLLKREMEKEADKCSKNFYEMVTKCVDDIRVEKTKGKKSERILLNLSCLLPLDASKKLGEELEKIDKMEEFSVHFTGPWPPYSFT